MALNVIIYFIILYDEYPDKERAGLMFLNLASRTKHLFPLN